MTNGYWTNRRGFHAVMCFVESWKIQWSYSLHVRNNPTPWPLNYLNSRVPGTVQIMTKTGTNSKNWKAKVEGYSWHVRNNLPVLRIAHTLYFWNLFFYPSIYITGLLFSQDEYWAETRRITHSLLKQFGFGKASTLETLIIEELKVFSDELKSQLQNGEAVIEISNQFQTVFMNSIWSLATGTRFEHDDPELHRLLELNRQYAECAQIGGGIAGLFPEVLYRFPNWSGYNKLKGIQSEMQKFMEVYGLIVVLRGCLRLVPFSDCFPADLDVW